ncbi:MAG: hypothetical protein COW24_02000 [Candidatus Kerfeldbacteria bacterium CG15_BIG_FIL_POST_REV_8_21_14_020_45_12]|uniref:Uncharacterized protein n=1 Tax=Candidatus Kerfeldbacteria bacterium CG15_BIG_FIL_POST_REV_8_21_14_020_45_12 TaxID=2014247 RepID=A0A2M7H4D1_9BACT|nr:MAG: hypothetical protein COW24_02000 [Candidatus Kerfeldbacteria bacterium CG15_BIG_FIL_POST_REV_8_21_14_020_45_12]PJA93618.1 MAG: hypothetical protein CO132_02200 [Candidatus Kerfeldbacteria bacterium CG_4_9_14_3_um_filter_45_8]
MNKHDSLPKRQRTLIGRGGDTSAWKLDKVKPEVGATRNGLVMKTFEGYNERHRGWEADKIKGFNQPVREYLEETHQRLRSQYGDAILPCRVVANPDESGRYFLLQAHADPKNYSGRSQLLLELTPDDIQNPDLQQRIGNFATSLKENYERWVRGDRTAVVPDIEKANIILDQAGERFYYIDNEAMEAPYAGKTLNRWFDLESVAARLEMMSGKTAEQILADPFYQALFAKYAESYPALETARTDDREFYVILMQMGDDIRSEAIAEFERYMASAK